VVNALIDSWVETVQGFDNVAPETDQIIVAAFQGDPGNWDIALP
jgi:hypothetical protein